MGHETVEHEVIFNTARKRESATPLQGVGVVSLVERETENSDKARDKAYDKNSLTG